MSKVTKGFAVVTGASSGIGAIYTEGGVANDLKFECRPWQSLADPGLLLKLNRK